MSQKKVDAYKARKGLHNKTDRKEKVLFGLEMFAWAFICVVIVAWIGYSAYVKVTGAKENVVQNTVMDTTALDNYISNLSTDASDGTDSTDADTAEEEDTTASTDTDSEDADAADTTADDSETETADKSEEADDTNVHSLQRLYMDLEQMRLMRRLQLRYMQQREDHLTILL